MALDPLVFGQLGPAFARQPVEGVVVEAPVLRGGRRVNQGKHPVVTGPRVAIERIPRLPVIRSGRLRQSQLPTPRRAELSEEDLGDSGEVQRLIGQTLATRPTSNAWVGNVSGRPPGDAQAHIAHTGRLAGPSRHSFRDPGGCLLQQYPWTDQRLKSRIVAVAVATATTSPDSSTSSPDMKAKSLPFLTTRPRPIRRPGLAGRRNWM